MLDDSDSGYWAQVDLTRSISDTVHDFERLHERKFHVFHSSKYAVHSYWSVYVIRPYPNTIRSTNTLARYLILRQKPTKSRKSHGSIDGMKSNARSSLSAARNCSRMLPCGSWHRVVIMESVASAQFGSGGLAHKRAVCRSFLALTPFYQAIC